VVGIQLSTISTRRHGASPSLQQVRLPKTSLLQTKGALLAGVSAVGIIMALVLALGVAPAEARTKNKALHKEADRTGSDPFGSAPKGPVQIFVSIDQQKLHLYSDGTRVADTSVATGVPSLPTPTGVFSVIQKQVFHRSNIYSGAPMPFMQRITWSGVALHEGENIGHPASHGCIRMPGEFAARLYKFTRIGARVIVTRGELKPTDFADPHLFMHKDIQAAASAPSLLASGAVKTAQTIDNSKASDASAAMPAKPAELGLRGSSANVTASFVLASDDAKPDVAAVDAPKADAPKSDAAQADAAKPAVAADAVKPDTAKSDAPDTKAPAARSSDPKAEAPAVTGSTPAPVTPVIAAPEAPSGKPADVAKTPPIKKSPIAIFISRKERKIFVRQDFEPVFEEAITIAHPEEPMGTHVFTAMEYLADNTTFRWNVVSMPGEVAKASKAPRVVADEDSYDRHGRRRHRSDDQPIGELPSPETPQQALARIDLPQDAVDYISQRMVPGSSLIVSDHGIGDETGEGTDFIVVTR
jgi:hypothetical protein